MITEARVAASSRAGRWRSLSNSRRTRRTRRAQRRPARPRGASRRRASRSAAARVRGRSAIGASSSAEITRAAGSVRPRTASTAAPPQRPRVARSRVREARRVPTAEEKSCFAVRFSSHGRASSPVRAGAKSAAPWAAAATRVARGQPRRPCSRSSCRRRPRTARKVADVSAATNRSRPSVARRRSHTACGRAIVRIAANSATATAAPTRRPAKRPVFERSTLVIAYSASAVEALPALPFHHLLEEAPVDGDEVGENSGQPHQGADDDEDHRQDQRLHVTRG